MLVAQVSNKIKNPQSKPNEEPWKLLVVLDNYSQSPHGQPVTNGQCLGLCFAPQEGHALIVASDGLWDAFSDDDAGEAGHAELVGFKFKQI